MRQFLGLGLSVLLLTAVTPMRVAAQDSGDELGNRVAGVVMWQKAIDEHRREQIETMRREREVLRGNADAAPQSQLEPEANSPGDPMTLVHPWVFEPTLQRQALEKRWPEAFAEQREEIAKAGPEIVKLPWFASVSQSYAANIEYETKKNWLDGLTSRLSEDLKRLETLSGAQRTVLEKDIQLQVDLAERVACTLVRCDWPDQTAPETADEAAAAQIAQPVLPDKVEFPSVSKAAGAGAEPNAARPKLEPMTGFAPGLLDQIDHHDEALGVKANDMDADAKIAAAKQAAGDGKAGGGGVSLYLPATIEGPLDPRAVNRAAISDGHLALEMRDGTTIRMPDMPLDDLAVAMRVIFGPDRLLEGKLQAIDGEAVVFNTGPEQFGDVVWRISYLPEPLPQARIGERIGLPIAPAIGILPLPEPSVSRITYYGDIANTHVGQVLFDADQLLGYLLTGADPETGDLVRPADVPGFMTGNEILARAQAGLLELPPAAAAEPVPNDPHEGAWWRDTTFLVWVPAAMRFRYVPDSGRIEPADTGMKLEVWTSNPEGARPYELALTDFVTANFDALAGHYPVLGEMENVAETVAIVRWFKINDIPVDLEWARTRNVAPAKTPDRVRDVATFIQYGQDRKPVFRKAEGAQ